MKIGLVISKFEPRRGGAELWTFEFAQRLLARGHEVHLVSSAFAEEISAWPFVTHRVAATRSRLGIRRRCRGEVANAFARCDPRHGDGLALRRVAAAWGRVAGVHPGQSTVAAALGAAAQIGNPFRFAPLWHLPRTGLRQFANPHLIVVAVSQMVANDILRFHPIRPEQIEVVYNGVDTERFSPDRRRNIGRRFVPSWA